MIPDKETVYLLAVRADGTLSLYDIPTLKEVQTGSIVCNRYNYFNEKGSKVLTSAIYQDIQNNWMLISSCQKSHTVNIIIEL